MSWYVRTLLLSASSISNSEPSQVVDSKEAWTVVQDIVGNDILTVFELLKLPVVISLDLSFEMDDITYHEFDLEDNDYTNLLLLCKKIKDLYLSGNISKYEVSLISKLMDGETFTSIANDFGKKDIRPLKKDFEEVCNKLAFALGGGYTDDGYINYMVEKYNLTSEQSQTLLQFMEKDRR